MRKDLFIYILKLIRGVGQQHSIINALIKRNSKMVNCFVAVYREILIIVTKKINNI